ncbi:hypothetical protein LTR10_005709 [Elasticomyces elasticus]|nr:hypothetical protein LTR10_005709 [Elasticomyces elasticus]KAK4964917.1 hypothetical protein LTR42_012334 [Elasticomyces elasticus]
MAIALTEEVLGFVTVGSMLYIADLRAPEKSAIATRLPSLTAQALKSDGETIAVRLYPDTLGVYKHRSKKLELYRYGEQNMTVPGFKGGRLCRGDILVSEARGIIDMFGHASATRDPSLGETNSANYSHWIEHERFLLGSSHAPLVPIASSFVQVDHRFEQGYYGFGGDARATGTKDLYRIRLDMETQEAHLEYTDGSPHSSAMFDAKTGKLYLERHRLTGLEHGRLSGAVRGHILRWRDAVYCIHYLQDWRLTVFTVRPPDIDAAGNAEGLAQYRNTLGRRVNAHHRNQYEHPIAAFVNDLCIVNMGHYSWESMPAGGPSGRVSVLWFDEASTLAGGYDTGFWTDGEEARFPWTLDLDRQYVIPKARDSVAAARKG